MLKIKVKNFNLNDSISSGQFFRYEKESDNSYTIILSDRVVNVKQDNDELIVTSNNYDNLEEVIRRFFDLDTDYIIFNNEILKVDSSLKDIINSSIGFKILKMEPFETIISYIISANNNVSNIRNSVNLLSKKYGKKVLFNNSEYYLFPECKSLKDITIEELNSMKMGFRSKYVLQMINRINNKEIDIESINNMSTKEAMEYLIKESGIGIKVASCILLFSYSKYDVFPIDTWVKKTMGELYNTTDVKTIKKIVEEKYGKYSGIVIQYMFNYKRNK
jgi:N-glycosylase/DNA lyase